MALFKKLTSHGSISIPIAMRRELGLEGRDPMIVEEKEGKIIISPYRVRCVFCGSMDRVVSMKGKGICEDCAKSANEKTKGLDA